MDIQTAGRNYWFGFRNAGTEAGVLAISRTVHDERLLFFYRAGQGTIPRPIFGVSEHAASAAIYYVLEQSTGFHSACRTLQKA